MDTGLQQNRVGNKYQLKILLQMQPPVQHAPENGYLNTTGV